MIDIHGIRKSFRGTDALRGIELHVNAGTVFALLGPNGAGKTTLVSILATLVTPDAGSARVAGFDVVRDRDEVTRRISLTGQSAAVDGVLSARENLRMMAQLSGLGRRASRVRTEELLERFELGAAADRRVRGYSGGMRRRLDLAISLILAPQLVFLDEPTTGLDTRSRQALWDEIRALAAGGTTVLLTTQYLEEADQLADRVAVIDRGVIVADGTPAELKAAIGQQRLTVTDTAGEVLAELATDGTPAELRRALAAFEGTDAASVTLRSPTLDDVFLAVTGDAAGLAHPEPALATTKG